MDLNSILEEVARGKLDPKSARKLIEKLGAKVSSKNQESKRDAKQGNGLAESAERAGGPADDLDASESKELFKSAFDRLKKSVHIEELIKISSGIVHQIAENMPNQFEKIQENFSANLNTLGFSANNNGVESRLSVFRTFNVSPDSLVAENQVVGSQWFGVNFAETAEVKKNKFAAVQFSEVSIVRSNLCSNNMSLSRLSNVTLQEARFESNRISRTTFSDVSITEADFTNNKLAKSEFAQTVLNGSRLSGNQFIGVDFTECEFDACDIQGILFENCNFRECAFHKIEINGTEPVKISNKSFHGKSVSNCNSVEKLLAALESDEAPAEEVKTEQHEPTARQPQTFAHQKSQRSGSEARPPEARTASAKGAEAQSEVVAEPQRHAQQKAHTHQPRSEGRADQNQQIPSKPRAGNRQPPRDDIVR